MKGLHLLIGLGVTLCVAGAAACGGDEDGTGGGTSTGPGSGGAGGGTTTTTTTTGGGGSGGSSGSGGGGGAGGGMSIACDQIPMGPFNPTEVLNGLDGSEDFAFDGKGSIAARQGNQVVLVDAAGTVTTLVNNAPNGLGLRYRGDGNLAAAMQGAIRTISPAGMIADYVTGLSGPNGVYPDAAGNVWVTEFGGDRVIRINPDQSVSTIVDGAPNANNPNGIVYDAGRELLFYTNYGAGEIMRVDMAAGGEMTPVLVATINGALDGLVLDACGNLYVVDNSNDDLYRVRLDAAGAMVGDPELLASFPENVANAQFGAGQGFEPETLYVGGQPGSIFAVPVGVPGAPVPMPP